MSVRHLAAVADLVGIGPTCKLLLYGLAVAADRTGWATASGSGLKQLTGLSERAIRTNLKKLRDLGYIEQSSGYRVKLKLP